MFEDCACSVFVLAWPVSFSSKPACHGNHQHSIWTEQLVAKSCSGRVICVWKCRAYVLEPSYLHKGSDWRLCFMCFLFFAPASFVIASKPSSKFQGLFPQFPRGARCASNALQQLHHSFNFYFFTGPNSHISNGRGLLGLVDTKGFPVLLHWNLCDSS